MRVWSSWRAGGTTLTHLDRWGGSSRRWLGSGDGSGRAGEGGGSARGCYGSARVAARREVRWIGEVELLGGRRLPPVSARALGSSVVALPQPSTRASTAPRRYDGGLNPGADARVEGCGRAPSVHGAELSWSNWKPRVEIRGSASGDRSEQEIRCYETVNSLFTQTGPVTIR